MSNVLSDYTMVLPWEENKIWRIPDCWKRPTLWPAVPISLSVVARVHPHDTSHR